MCNGVRIIMVDQMLKSTEIPVEIVIFILFTLVAVIIFIFIIT